MDRESFQFFNYFVAVHLRIGANSVVPAADLGSREVRRELQSKGALAHPCGGHRQSISSPPQGVKLGVRTQAAPPLSRVSAGVALLAFDVSR
jgi:hypothetical protein